MKTKVFKIKSKSGSEILISNVTLKSDEKAVNVSIVDEAGCVVGESIGHVEVENLIEILLEMINKTAVMVNHPPHLVEKAEFTIGGGSKNEKHLIKMDY